MEDSAEKLPSVSKYVADYMRGAFEDKSLGDFQMRIFKVFAHAILLITNTIDRGIEKRNALEARIRELEKRINLQAKAIDYRGVWRDGMLTKAGDLVTHQGTLWHCDTPTESRPGTDETWRMMVKTQR